MKKVLVFLIACLTSTVMFAASYTITLSASPEGAGNVTGGGTYSSGKQLTVKATANNGYAFVRWTENGEQVSTQASYKFTVNSNRNLVAEFVELQYTPVAIGQTRVYITGKLYINDVLYYDPESGISPQYLEIGVFDQDGVCRGTKTPLYRENKDEWVYQLQMYGVSGMTYPTFKVYDHESGQELGLVPAFPDEVIGWGLVENDKYGSLTNPYYINFNTITTGITKEINGWTVEITEGEAMSNGWYLLATPVGTVVPSLVENMTENQYDLYRFDQAASNGLEWINLKGSNESLVPGKGYLYANSDTITITFPGEPYTEAVTVNLLNEEGCGLAGWNLVGNPWNQNAFVGNHSFYVMNEAGTDIAVTNRNYLEPMEGAFIFTEENEELAFSTEGGDPDAMLALNVSSNSKVIDRAVVSFGQERTLPKFQLNPNHTKVYIPQENRDYAVVAAEEMGEMPVSFKAEKNGSYTLNFTAQEVSFAYLHLIDNKTGKDVDLLESPAYSFNALTTDYANRFKLVFATGNNSEDNFAFNSNGLWIISNDGEATLQVVDVTGRILSSETISGSCSKAISAAPGVYMLRLINGDNMKVQKVVVK